MFTRDTAIGTVKQMVDQFSVEQVLGMLAIVCRGKAGHVETNWGDRGLAQHWAGIAKKLEALQSTCNV